MLPYRLDGLQWDSAHHFNSDNKYSYSGKQRKLGDPMLQCEMCMQFFHRDETQLSQAHNFVPFQTNYRFVCKICSQNEEKIEFLDNSWSAIVATALHNLQLPLAATNKEMCDSSARITPVRSAVPLTEVARWIRNNWGSLCLGRHEPQLEDVATISRSVVHLDYVNYNADKGEVQLRHLLPTKLILKPVMNSMVTSSSAAAPKPKRERDTSARDNAGKKSRAVRPPVPQDISQIKLPDKYKLVPAPKADPMVAAVDLSVVQLSRVARAPQITVCNDGMSAVGFKGYRMVRASHCATQGAWYFEVRIDEPLHGEDGHTRIGWSTEMGELQAPVGYDSHSYSYRDIEGTKFHKSMGQPYGAAYGPGDVIGCALQMGDPPAVGREYQRILLKGVEYIVKEERESEPSIGSTMIFYKNGISQGVAFSDVEAEPYYPSVSLYKSARVTVNFGPKFDFPPEMTNLRPICELASMEDADAMSEASADQATSIESPAAVP